MSEGVQSGALAELRREIDRLDAVMHEALMERGRIIDRLIATKGTTASGSAFRPEREASMMLALLQRHHGLLPLDAIEGIWRIVISTFTHVQAPFAVHADVSVESDAVRDSARFHFGFTVPLRPCPDAGAAIAAVAASRGDLALIPVAGARSAWWRALEDEDAPKIIAHLPFLDRPDHPAAIPLMVVAKSVSGEGLGGIRLYALDGRPDEAALVAVGARMVARAQDSSLVATPRDLPADRLAAACGTSMTLVGSHPVVAPIRPHA